MDLNCKKGDMSIINETLLGTREDKLWINHLPLTGNSLLDTVSEHGILCQLNENN